MHLFKQRSVVRSDSIGGVPRPFRNSFLQQLGEKDILHNDTTTTSAAVFTGLFVRLVAVVEVEFTAAASL